MPESRHKYLYERLGDHDFQLLVDALLTARFTDFVPLPLRQAEGGRDGIRDIASDKTLIYQVKWSGRARETNPVTWLDTTLRDEADNIRRLASEGVKKYVLVTNLPSTGKPGTGTFDRMNEKLEAHEKTFGLEMACLWRESVDGMVDGASTEIKWAYADMLAGWDLVRYLISEDSKAQRDRGLRDLLRKVADAQWSEDERVKFSQVDIDREKVADLFVDVTADRLLTPVQARRHRLRGVAAYLLRTESPFTLVRGAPGQGKSTLSQYVCQAHRSAFVPDASHPASLPDVNAPRFPLRFDLSDYAAWLNGVDVWDATEERPPTKHKRRPAAQATIECFLAELMTYAAGGISVDAKDVQALFDRVPSLVVMDGLDEVGTLKTRKKVVTAIDRFCGRSQAYSVPPRIVVTTRPSAGQLPEPSPELFEVLALNPLDQKQRDDYLRKWCAVRGIHGKEGRSLRTSFREKSAEPYIAELAGNPMQLTILLDLLHRQGAATATQRTELYDSYVNLLLAREANKHPESVRKHRAQLLEIIPFLGWYLQSRSEDRVLSGRMSSEDLAAAMRHFQRTYGKPESVVDELFEATTDRLWALTSKVEDSYEFEVASLREYFAARFLYSYAGEEIRGFDRAVVFRELLKRSYWLNTVRFYGGNAHGSDLYMLVAGIRDELAESLVEPAQIAAWTLLTDGVFTSRPREAAEVLDVLCSDAGIAVLMEALSRKEIRPIPQLPTADGTTNPTWTRLTGEIAANPGDPLNHVRMRALRELLNQRGELARWWADQTRNAIGSCNEAAWLHLGAGCEVAAGLTADLPGVNLAGHRAQLLLNTGLVPPVGGQLEAGLLQAVLDGQCPETTSLRSMPAQVAVALAAPVFFTTSDSGFVDVGEGVARRRSEATALLRKSGSPYSDIAAHRRFKHGQKGSTFPWSSTASALFDHAGRCWLASEIAIIGASSPHQSGFTLKPGTAAFGPNAHPASLISAARKHAADSDWWRQQLTMATDDLAQAEWVLAVWTVASGSAITALLPEVETTFAQLPGFRRHAVRSAARRISTAGWLLGRPVTATAGTDDVAQLLAERTPESRIPVPHGAQRYRAAPDQSAAPALLTVARSAKWLKVDAVATYR